MKFLDQDDYIFPLTNDSSSNRSFWNHLISIFNQFLWPSGTRISLNFSKMTWNLWTGQFYPCTYTLANYWYFPSIVNRKYSFWSDITMISKVVGNWFQWGFEFQDISNTLQIRASPETIAQLDLETEPSSRSHTVSQTIELGTVAFGEGLVKKSW